MCDNKKYCTQLALMLETESGRNNTSAARVAKLCQFNYYKFNTCIGVDTLHRKFISFLLFVIHTLYNLFQQILQINYNSRRQKFCFIFCFIESCMRARRTRMMEHVGIRNCSAMLLQRYRMKTRR